MNAATLDLVAVDWERVQLVVRFRAITGPPPATTGFCLTRERRWSRSTVPPTSERRDGDEVAVRFDVMRGPSRQPMGAGTWTLTDARGGTPHPARLRTGTPPPVANRSFRLLHARYDAAVTLDPARGHLAVRIQVDPLDGRIPPGWPRWRLGHRVAHTLRVTGHRTSRRLFVALARSTTRRSGRRVVFASAAHAGLHGNLQVVWDRMVARGLAADRELVVLHLPARSGRIRGWRDRWRRARVLLGAEAILVAGSRNRSVYAMPYAADVRFIQLWHASGAFKTVGYSRVGRPDGPDPYALVHKTYSHAIVSSDHDIPFYAEAFGISEARVVPTGIPRMDRFFDEAARAAGIQAALGEFPVANGRAVWLIAPTYRGPARRATYPHDRIDFAGLHALAVARDAVVIFKMHPFVREPVPIPAEYRDRLIDGTTTAIDVNDLLFVVDLLITDYSSIVFEFSTLGRPMLFFAYDLDEYTAERDFYVPFEEFVPGRIVRTFAELLDAIRRDDYEAGKVGEFARRHFDHLDGTSTDRVIDELVLGR